MKKHNAYVILAAAISLLGSSLFAACSKDEAPEPTPLATPAVQCSDITYLGATFTWDAIEGCRQYGWRLIDDATGADADAGVTTTTTLTFDKLNCATDYTFMMKAFPLEEGPLESEFTTVSIHTPFYDQLVEREGTYTTYLNDEEGESWTATLNEDRSGEAYVNETFGVFTLKGFYNRATTSLVFTVNEGNTISIQNATGYDADGWAIVATGRPQTSLKTLYIDESSSKFDYLNRTLTYKAKLPKSTQALTETFAW